ncbi:hypothetical protein [Kitasatospora sp. NPDC018619]|uniref:hypothetical protein n=1 Tax=unclassified Kitasatospora TaxID=2633591 RepID=UPI00378D152C
MTAARTRRRLPRAAALPAATAVAAGAALPAAEAKPPKGATARISEGPRGEQLTTASTPLGLSEDGRSALFTSAAPELLPGPGTPNSDEVYVRNLRNGHLERVSVADDGSRLNAPTTQASISGDGRYVAFSTTATNVVPGRPAHASGVFVRDAGPGTPNRSAPPRCRAPTTRAGTGPSAPASAGTAATSPTCPTAAISPPGPCGAARTTSTSPTAGPAPAAWSPSARTARAPTTAPSRR